MTNILVAEDDANVAAFIQRALKSRGWAGHTVSDGEQVMRALRQQAWDLVLLDLMMPGTEGVETLVRVRACVPNQKVIVVSASSDSATKVAALSAGAADYLCKPFSIEELLARAEHRMRGGGDAHRYLRHGRLVVDLGRRRTTVDNREVRLTEREFALLVHLIESQDAGERVSSRQALLSAVWGSAFEPGSNVVDVYIRRLRAKLGADTIETIRSVGYCLVAS